MAVCVRARTEQTSRMRSVLTQTETDKPKGFLPLSYRGSLMIMTFGIRHTASHKHPVLDNKLKQFASTAKRILHPHNASQTRRPRGSCHLRKMSLRT